MKLQVRGLIWAFTWYGHIRSNFPLRMSEQQDSREPVWIGMRDYVQSEPAMDHRWLPRNLDTTDNRNRCNDPIQSAPDCSHCVMEVSLGGNKSRLLQASMGLDKIYPLARVSVSILASPTRCRVWPQLSESLESLKLDMHQIDIWTLGLISFLFLIFPNEPILDSQWDYIQTTRVAKGGTILS